MSNASKRGVAHATLFHSGLIAALVGFGLYFDHAAIQEAPVATARPDTESGLSRHAASPDVRRLVRWVLAAQDHENLPFLVVDKVNARIYAFDPEGRLRAAAPVLLGAGRGDHDQAPATPAGRFVAASLEVPRGAIVWANATSLLELHAVPSPRSPGRGTERLASADAKDKRISEGSLHVAADFYRGHLDGLRSGASVVYVLPETTPVDRLFTPVTSGPPDFVAQPFTGTARRAS